MAVGLMLFSGYIYSGNHKYFHDYSSQNSDINYRCSATPSVQTENSSSKANLTIISRGLPNGSLWSAIIENKTYSTNKSTLEISLDFGNYTIRFNTSERYARPDTVCLNTFDKGIYANFFRLVNFSTTLNSLNDPIEEASGRNITAVLGSNDIEIYNQTNNFERETIPLPQEMGTNFRHIGWNGSDFILGGDCYYSSGIQLYAFYPFGSYLNGIGNRYYTDHYSISCLSGYSLISMSVGRDEVFISGINQFISSKDSFGIFNLSNSHFTNLNAYFPKTTEKMMTSYYGNGNFIVGVGKEWYLINGKSLNVKPLGIGNIISPLGHSTGNQIQSNYITFNGSDFFIGNGTRIACFNPEKNLTKIVYSVSSSMNISLIYANTSTVIAGIYNSSQNFSLFTINSKNSQVPLFESIKNNGIKGPNISYITTYGSSIIFIGCNLRGIGGSFYIFTNLSFGIKFREYGLPPGLSWVVQIGSMIINSTSPCIRINNLSSGLYYYYIGSSSNFNSSIGSGHFIYTKGIPINLFVTFSLRFSFIIKNLTINTEYGELRLKLNGLNLSNKGCSVINDRAGVSSNQIEVSENLVFGEYSYCAIYVQSYTRAISGYICVNQNSSFKVLNFVSAQSTVSFNLENNVSNQCRWTVQASTSCCFDSRFCTRYSYNETTIQGFGEGSSSTILRDGYYQYHVIIDSNKLDPSGNNIVYGSFCVNGSNLNINITFQQKYPVYIHEKGLYKMGSPCYFVIDQWCFSIFNIEGNKTVQVSSRNYLYQPVYCICLPNGTYVGEASEMCRKYNTVTNNETFIINGSSLNISFKFVPYTYSVLINESGLSGPYKWYVNTTFGNYSALAGNSITIYETNGSYFFTVTANTKTYVGQQYTYWGFLYGTNKTYNVTFVKSVQVKVMESGLPKDFIWYLNLSNQRPLCSNNASATAYYPPGKFNFIATSGASIYSTHRMANHTFTVHTNAILYLNFTPYTYSFSTEAFYHGGRNYNYSVILEGGYSHLKEVYYSNSSYETSFSLQNGTYNYIAVSSNNEFRNITGILGVSGFGYHGIELDFKVFSFNATFLELGLKNKVGWGITIRRGNEIVYNISVSGLFATVRMHNGTYFLTAGTPSKGYFTNVVNRTQIINSDNPVIRIKFYTIETLTSQLLNLYGPIGISQYFSFLLIGTILIASTLVYLQKRRISKS